MNRPRFTLPPVMRRAAQPSLIFPFVLAVLAALSASGAQEASARAPAAAPPNFLLILADDLGFSDLGCYGSEFATPHLDRLARDGVRFTQFYNTARCWPTRAAIVTGYYAKRVGLDVGDRPAADCGPLASGRIPALLALEIAMSPRSCTDRP